MPRPTLRYAHLFRDSTFVRDALRTQGGGASCSQADFRPTLGRKPRGLARYYFAEVDCDAPRPQKGILVPAGCPSSAQMTRSTGVAKKLTRTSTTNVLRPLLGARVRVHRADAGRAVIALGGLLPNRC